MLCKLFASYVHRAVFDKGRPANTNRQAAQFTAWPIRCPGSLTRRTARLVAEQLFQLFDFIFQPNTGLDLAINFADRVENRGVVTVAKAASDLGQ